MTRSQNSRILLGHVSGAQGIKGEVVVHAHTAVPEDIGAYGRLCDAAGLRTFDLKVLRVTSRGVVCRIAGITDRTAAEALRGTELYVDRAQLPEPEAEEFYHADLIGLTAINIHGTPLGTATAIQNFGAGDLIEIRLSGAAGTELFPFTRAVVPTIDFAARTLVLVPPPESPDDPDEAS